MVYMPATSVKLRKQFTDGIFEKHGITAEEVKTNWKYCGGADGCHLNYFNLHDGLEHPPIEDKCVCGVIIEHQCYIKHKYSNRLITIGSCCIKRFCDTSGRSCEKCNAPHRNRVVNRCNDCRFGVCDDCGDDCNSSYSRCGLCNYKKKVVIDVDDDICGCGAKKNPAYPKCYACKFDIPDGSGVCDCGKKIGLKYRKCFGCNQNSL